MVKLSMSLKVTKLETLFQKAVEESEKPGLYIVATDIGNPADITIRALAVLHSVDLVICEERRIGEALLKRYGIFKPLELLNEHNEQKQTGLLLQQMLSSKIKAALISDNGTPLFADPGSNLVQKCRYYNVPVFPVPGASSLMAALMATGKKNEDFLYYGFLPAAKEERIIALKKLKKKSETDLIFLEAPYRLKQFLRDMITVLGDRREGIIAYRLTCSDEKMISGKLPELRNAANDLPKGEFVFILLAEKRIERK